MTQSIRRSSHRALLLLSFFPFKTSARKCIQSPAPPPPTQPNPLPFIFIASVTHSHSLSRTRAYTMNNNRQHQPHVSPSSTDYSSFDFNLRPSKRRGSYNCGRCGQPKKGHSCHVGTPSTPSPPAATPAPSDSSAAISAPTSLSSSRPPRHQHYSRFRRALSFDNIDLTCESPEPDFAIEELLDPDPELSGGLPAAALWEVLRRLPPPGLLAAAQVCKGWRETSRRLWRAAEELRLRVPPRAQVGFVGSVLQKCSALVRLSLTMERLGLWAISLRSRVLLGALLGN